MSPPDHGIGAGGTTPRAVVFGCSGATLLPEERAFFRDADPLGFILFGRNCESPDQIRALTQSLRESVGRTDAPVLIDQEGGTVMRLRPPQWHGGPEAARIGRLHRRDRARAREAAHALGRLFGAELAALGIDVDCAPVLDLGLPETTAAIGPRAWSDDPERIAELAGAMADGLMEEGVLPIIKHMPGHGRARVDSHRVLPRVSADLTTLRTTDFAPFRALSRLPLGMSAHVVYEAIDRACPATVSRTVIGQAIRGEIGFDGFLFSDDIAMSALSGTPGERAAAALAAGCDSVLHCTGDLVEMRDVAASIGTLAAESLSRWSTAQATRSVRWAEDAGNAGAMARRLDASLSSVADI